MESKEKVSVTNVCAYVNLTIQAPRVLFWSGCSLMDQNCFSLFLLLYHSLIYALILQSVRFSVYVSHSITRCTQWIHAVMALSLFLMDSLSLSLSISLLHSHEQKIYSKIDRKFCEIPTTYSWELGREFRKIRIRFFG